MRLTIRDIQKMAADGIPIPMLTAYDATSARLSEAAGVPMLLVGDSLGMVIQGHTDPIPVTMEHIIYHCSIVTRVTDHAFVVGDLPFMSYNVSPEQALENAARLMQEGRANAVKLEGGEALAPTIARIVQAGIPVMGHVGLTPQSVYKLGGMRLQGKDVDSARQVLHDAQAVQAAGAFAIVLEAIPAPLAKLVSDKLAIPTIGIGAGPDCDGQVQVFHDLVGLFEDFVPRHAKPYVQLAPLIRDAVNQYVAEVEAKQFPDADHSFSMKPEILAALEAEGA
ncbi:MAG: 3-methyl-2-oxobutanoate hydroxymethyltransferase [Anaerolineaceae bacterium]|nr:3-methyl-2-oxobutanoate hydroxymethyltransferase [Anaerolineaceae bacterium]